uniref:Uncharacterized protein n=1 Tax=Dikerogammarus haemobaphes virus 1 TaxID=2704946 RepID=A0A6G9HDJ5_9VIRU|nr:hypothetical protein [Dikerogammarus haemobaphes virus 1]
MNVIFNKILNIIKDDTSTILDFESILLEDLKFSKESIFDKTKPYLQQTSVSNYDELKSLILNMSNEESLNQQGSFLVPAINLIKTHQEEIKYILDFLLESVNEQVFLQRAAVLIKSLPCPDDLFETLNFLLKEKHISLSQIKELLSNFNTKINTLL